MKSPAVFFVVPFMAVFSGLIIYDRWFSDELKPNETQIIWSDNLAILHCSKKCTTIDIQKAMDSVPGLVATASICSDLPEKNQCVIHFQTSEEVMGWPNAQACPYSREKGAKVCI